MTLKNAHLLYRQHSAAAEKKVDNKYYMKKAIVYYGVVHTSVPIR